LIDQFGALGQKSGFFRISQKHPYHRITLITENQIQICCSDFSGIPNILNSLEMDGFNQLELPENSSIIR